MALIFIIKSFFLHQITEKYPCPLCEPIPVFSGVKIQMNKEIIWIYIFNHASILTLLSRRLEWNTRDMHIYHSSDEEYRLTKNLSLINQGHGLFFILFYFLQIYNHACKSIQIIIVCHTGIHFQTPDSSA